MDFNHHSTSTPSTSNSSSMASSPPPPALPWIEKGAKLIINSTGAAPIRESVTDQVVVVQRDVVSGAAPTVNGILVSRSHSYPPDLLQYLVNHYPPLADYAILPWSDMQINVSDEDVDILDSSGSPLRRFNVGSGEKLMFVGNGKGCVLVGKPNPAFTIACEISAQTFQMQNGPQTLWDSLSPGQFNNLMPASLGFCGLEIKHYAWLNTGVGIEIVISNIIEDAIMTGAAASSPCNTITPGNILTCEPLACIQPGPELVEQPLYGPSSAITRMTIENGFELCLYDAIGNEKYRSTFENSGAFYLQWDETSEEITLLQYAIPGICTS